MPGMLGVLEALDQPAGNSASTSALAAALVGVPPELWFVPLLPEPPAMKPIAAAITAAMPKPMSTPRRDRRSRGSAGAAAATAAGRSVSGGGAAAVGGLTDDGMTVGARSSSGAGAGAAAGTGGGGAAAAGSGSGIAGAS